jgi:tight adherence protein B
MLVVIVVLIFVVTFLAASAAAGAGAILLALRPDRQPGASPVAQPAPGAETPLLLRQQLLSTISVWHELLARFDFATILKRRIAEAGLKWSVGRVTLLMLLLGSMGAAMALLLDWAPGLSAPVAAAAAALTPYFYILRKRRKRFQKIEEQFPDALDSLSQALRAGHPLGAGMILTADEAPEPLAQELRRASDEWKLGLPWNESLENLAQRVPLLEVRLFVAAVVLQSRFGGKLNEILEQLARTIRDSIALRGDVQAIAAQGRLTGTALTILPVAIVVIMLVTSPAYIGVLFLHPYGKYLISATVACLILGHFTIRRIVNIKV